MKYLSIILVLIAAACSSSSNNSINSIVSEKNILQLKINEEKTLQVPAGASKGLEMTFTLSDTSVAKVSRKQVVSTYDSATLRPGDPVLAIWVIKGLKRGTTGIKFSEPGGRKNEGATLSLKNYKIIVTD